MLRGTSQMSGTRMAQALQATGKLGLGPQADTNVKVSYSTSAHTGNLHKLQDGCDQEGRSKAPLGNHETPKSCRARPGENK